MIFYRSDLPAIMFVLAPIIGPLLGVAWYWYPLSMIFWAWAAYQFDDSPYRPRQ